MAKADAVQCAGGRQIQRGGIGCSSTQICCAERATSEKCSQSGDSRITNPDYSSEFFIPEPFVNWRKTQVLRPFFDAEGLQIFFKGRLTVTVKSDVTCVKCGKATKFSGVGATITKTIWIPKVIKGKGLAEKFDGTAIPGLNVALLATELKEDYNTIMAVKREVGKVLKSVRKIRDVFRCRVTGIDRQDAAYSLAHALSKKRGLLGESAEEAVLSESDIADMVNEAMSTDSEEQQFLELLEAYVEADNSEDAALDYDALVLTQDVDQQ
jgi:hypothetical protein